MRLVDRSETRDQSDPEIKNEARRQRRWLRKVLLLLGLILVGVMTGALVFGGGSAPVGFFRSAAGQDAYFAAYDATLAKGPAPSTQLDITTDFGWVRVLGYSTNKDVQPLVLLPGTQSGAPMWVDNIPTLAAERPVYVVDLLGQPGRSVQSRSITSHADDARWLAQVIEQLPGEQPAVLGHSLGGWLAMNLAVNEPAAAASVIVLDPVLTFGDLSFDAILRSIPASVSWFPKSWRDSFASWTANDAPVEDEPVAEMIEAGMQNYSLGTPSPTRFTGEQLAAADIPVLAIMAGKSRTHDAAAAAEYAEQTLPNATVKIYDGASHAINGEEPDRIAADVAEFLARQN